MSCRMYKKWGMYSKQVATKCRTVTEMSDRTVRCKVKSFFLTSELSFRSEKSLPRVVFGVMFREWGTLPWVLL